MKNLLLAAFSKLAALGLLAAVAGGAFLGAALPLIDRFETLDADISAKRQLLGHLLAKAVPADDRAQAPLAAPQYVAGETDAVRLAGLQTLLNETAEAHNIRLISSRAVDTNDQGDIRLVGVAAQLKAPLEELQRLLHDLETARGALVVESLQIMRQQGESAGNNLDVALVLRGAAPGRTE